MSMSVTLNLVHPRFVCLETDKVWRIAGTYLSDFGLWAHTHNCNRSSVSIRKRSKCSSKKKYTFKVLQIVRFAHQNFYIILKNTPTRFIYTQKKSVDSQSIPLSSITTLKKLFLDCETDNKNQDKSILINRLQPFLWRSDMFWLEDYTMSHRDFCSSVGWMKFRKDDIDE